MPWSHEEPLCMERSWYADYGRLNIHQMVIIVLEGRYENTFQNNLCIHNDVIKWKHFPLFWPFVRGIHRSPVNSPHKGQWRGALMFSLLGVWINDWVNNRETADLRRYRVLYDVTVMLIGNPYQCVFFYPGICCITNTPVGVWSPLTTKGHFFHMGL